MTPGYSSFGHWLKAQRKALDLTQDAFAHQVGCSAETLRKVEANRLRPSRAFAERLAKQLGLPPDQHDAFVHLARCKQDSAQPACAPMSPPAQSLLNLPTPLTPLVGRAHEGAQVRTLLEHDATRLLVLVGPPGVGKTHLGLHVAGQMRAHFADGIAFVALSALNDPAQVPSAIAQLLGLTNTTALPHVRQVCHYLRDRQMLLVLDNFEHVLAAAPYIAEWLAAAPRLTVLATSRASLNISGEQVFAVSPLELPDLSNLPSVAVLTQCASVDLFVQRSRAVNLDFVLTEANARAVAEICIALDGVPLAIELAAARSKYFSPQALRTRLEQRLDRLTGGARNLPLHQQTLRGALDWSYQLLSAVEQQLLAWLGVFAGGGTLTAIESICANVAQLPDSATHTTATTALPAAQILDVLASLVDKSLLRTQLEPGAAEPRFTLLHIIREYALEQLVTRGALNAVRQQHAAYYLTLIEEAQEQVRGPNQAVWLDRIEREYDNLRAALCWAWAQGEREVLLRLTTALCQFWTRRGHFEEGKIWTQRALALADAHLLPPALRLLRARILMTAWSFAIDLNDQGMVTTLPPEDLTFWRASGEWRGLSYALHTTGMIAIAHGDYATARAVQQENVDLCRRLGDEWHLAVALFCLVMNIQVTRDVGADDDALVAESVRWLRSTGDHWALSYLLGFMGDMAVRRDDYATAHARLQEAVMLFRRVGDSLSAAGRLHLLGVVWQRQHNYEQAARCFRESLALFHNLGDRRGITLCLIALAQVRATQGCPHAAARFLGAAAALIDDEVNLLVPPEPTEFAQTLAQARMHLDDPQWREAWLAGQHIPIGQICQEASRIMH